jgi:outer membrane receptor protein involved in Fe transport
MKKSPNLFQLKLILFCFFTLFTQLVFAQSKSISGKVTSASNGSALIGVAIREKGTSNATMTNNDGNFSISLSSANPVLILTSVGYSEKQVSVGNETNLNITMNEDVTSLSDVVVSATRGPVRRLETTTAIDIIQGKELQERTPVTLADAIRYTPGVYAQSSAGRYGGQIFIRGFPDGTGNGLVYTAVLLDGIPTLGSPTRPVDEFFKYDSNIEKIEIVRGNAAGLFGRAAAAGVVNMITKTGGEKHSGSVQISNYSNTFGSGLNPRVDLNVNGPISKNIRYNAGGFWYDDKGYRNAGAPDKGYQFRGNVDYLFAKNRGSVRVYGMLTDLITQNLIDSPYKVSSMSLADGWNSSDTYYNTNLDALSYNVWKERRAVTSAETPTVEVRSAKKSFEDGNYAKGGFAGINFNFDLGKGFTVSNKLRYMTMGTGTKFNLGVSSFYTSTPTSQIRTLIDGDGDNSDLINDFKIEKKIETGKIKNLISVGSYISRVNIQNNTFSFTYFGGLARNADYTLPVTPVVAGTITPASGRISRISDYDENTTSFYLSDEIKINNKTTINAGWRYDKVDMDLTDFMAPLVTGANADVTNPKIVAENRIVNLSDWSGSIGANQLIGENSAVYLNVVRAYRAPDNSTYTQVRRIMPVVAGKSKYDPAGTYSVLPNGIDKNEVVYNQELGYRTTVRDLGIDWAAFHTFIDNRLVTTYEGAQAVQRPLGNNRIVGSELTLTLTPSAVKGLVIRSGFTVQSAKFTDFKITPSHVTAGTLPGRRFDPTKELYGVNIVQVTQTAPIIYQLDLKGKQIPNVPRYIWNFSAVYSTKYFGIDLRSNLAMKRYNDPTNLISLPNLHQVEAGAFVQYKLKNSSDLKLRVNIQNVLNSQAVTRLLYLDTTDAALTQKQWDPDFSALYGVGVPLLPRRTIWSLSYSF